ncbi:MAG: HlyD family efflux transporter periplasmic adaptor subunit [Planctomycetes bacterium]|nr:HlyD family efflux transporter periplasmic adaptor subunit [Planctomycetota bacterium]
MRSQSPRRSAVFPCALLASALLGACAPDADHQQTAPSSSGSAAAGAGATNRIPIPLEVRRALGLSFVAVERRAVRETLRVPGHFELAPHARHELHASAVGRAELVKAVLEDVAVGDLLARIEAPAWRDLQTEMLSLVHRGRQVEIEQATVVAMLATHEEHHEALEARIQLWRARITELEALVREGAGRASDLNDARVAWRTVEGELAEHHEAVAEQQGRKRALLDEAQALEERRSLVLAHMAALQGLPVSGLLEPVGPAEAARPLWEALSAIEMRAAVSGRVECWVATPGAWVEDGAHLLTVVQPDQLWFRAQAMESDLGVLREGARAELVPPRWDGISPAEKLAAEVRFGLRATSAERTLELLLQPRESASWARAGVHAFAEVIVRESSRPELAVPLSCILRDEGKPIFFRRDPANPDLAIREEADLGFEDGRWVELLSGVIDGEEIVLDGAFQLLLASASSTPKGGHFHPDGSFHADEH